MPNQALVLMAGWLELATGNIWHFEVMGIETMRKHAGPEVTALAGAEARLPTLEQSAAAPPCQD